MRDLLNEFRTLREAAGNLKDAGCELLTVFGFLWQYTACTDRRKTAVEFRQLYNEFIRVAKRARALAAAVEELNEGFDLPPETEGEDTTLGALRYSTVLPTQLRTYAFFLENGPARWVSSKDSTWPA